MARAPEIRKIRDRIKRTNSGLEQRRADPKNVDRALWASLAVADFASVTGQIGYLQEDPETILGDLLAGLMHWTDLQKANPKRVDDIDFGHALDRARSHYTEECEYEREMREG